MMDIGVKSPGNLPSELLLASQMFPFAPPCYSKDDCMKEVVKHIPSLSEALELIHASFQHATHVVAPVEPTQIAEETIPVAYRDGEPVKVEAVTTQNLADLALLFAVFASGYITRSTSSQARDIDHSKFHYLAKASLNMHGIFDKGSIVTCQTLLLIGMCEMRLGRGAFRDASWRITNMAFTVAASVSLFSN